MLDRDITVGDEVFPINETVSTYFSRSFLDTSLKFYLVHKPRLDLGLFLGANIHFVKLTIANDISAADSGFESGTNRVSLLYPDGSQEDLPLLSKEDVADVLFARLVVLLAG